MQNNFTRLVFLFVTGNWTVNKLIYLKFTILAISLVN